MNAPMSSGPSLESPTAPGWRELVAGTSRHSRLGAMPGTRAMETLDERLVRAPLPTIFDLARRVEHWPAYLPHYRWVRVRERRSEDDMLVEMSANRPFGVANWPTWWLSEMTVQRHIEVPTIRFRHVGGITKGMEVEWSFVAEASGTRVRILHAWDGPRWPMIGLFAATTVIGPVFVHGIAERTLAGLAKVAERERRTGTGDSGDRGLGTGDS